MLDFISSYGNENEERINFKLMSREYDEDLVDLIISTCKSLEFLEYIKFIGFELETDESKIDLNYYRKSRKRRKKKKKASFNKRNEKDLDDFMIVYMQDSRYIELKLTFELTCKGEQEIITKRLLIPKLDKNGFYTIKGKKHFLIYQLVDSSTYTTGNGLSLKSLMPININRSKTKSVYDTTGEAYSAPIYKIGVYRKNMDILLFYFAQFGVTQTLKYFNVHKIIHFVEKEYDRLNYLYFPINSKMFLQVNKYFFNEYIYVRSIVFMIISIVTNRLRFEMLDNKSYWIERIGSINVTNSYNYYEKGMNILMSFNRMLDETTKSILKIDPSNKEDIYAVVRWIVQNFYELRGKDNLDLLNKRLRGNECVAALLVKEFSSRVSRVIFEGNRVKLDKVKNIFKFSGEVIIRQLHKSGMMKFDDRINDMDFFSKFKFTIKGPNSLGGNNDRNIANKYRGLHSSHIGRIDINVCGTSDPGLSGVLTPFVKTEGLFFDGSLEPEDGIFDLIKDVDAYTYNSGESIIDVYGDCENIYDYFKKNKKFQDVISKCTIKEIYKE